MTTNYNSRLSEALHDRSPAELAKIVYVVLFLILGSYFFERIVLRYVDGLVWRNQIGLWTRLVDYLDTAAACFFVVQLLIVVFFWRSGKRRFKVQGFSVRSIRVSVKNSALGVLVGLIVFVAGLPFLLTLDKHVGFIHLLVNRFFGVQTVFLAVLLVVILPIGSEIVFRGIVFGTLLDQLGFPAALLSSSLLFAYVWPVYDAGVALLLGIATAIVYHRSHSLIPGIIANFILTLACMLTLILRSL